MGSFTTESYTKDEVGVAYAGEQEISGDEGVLGIATDSRKTFTLKKKTGFKIRADLQ